MSIPIGYIGQWFELKLEGGASKIIGMKPSPNGEETITTSIVKWISPDRTVCRTQNSLYLLGDETTGDVGSRCDGLRKKIKELDYECCKLEQCVSEKHRERNRLMYELKELENGREG